MKKEVVINKKILVCLVLLCIGCSFVACGKTVESKLSGRWVLAEDSSSFLSEIEFFSDGTYVSSHSNYEGNYSVDGDRIRLQGILVDTKTFTFKIKGDTLTFYDGEGEEYCVYERVHEKIETTEEDEVSSSTESVQVSKEYHTIGSFKENKMWLRYDEGEASYIMCVDNTGRALFQFDSTEVTSWTDFSNGFAYITYNGNFSVIDSNGAILSSYNEDEYGTVRAYGDGYIFVEKYVSNFDTAFWNYTIYDQNGKVIYSFKLTNNDQIKTINYCGEGVFGLEIGNSTEFYCIKTEKFVPLEGNITAEFDNGIALVGIDYTDSNADAYRARLVFLTSEGKVSYVPVYSSWGWNWVGETFVKESNCILYWPSYSSDSVLVNYNTKMKKFYMLDEYYTEKINWDLIPEKYVYNSGVIAVPLIGSDNEEYVMVLDKKMKKIMEPIKCESFEYYTDGRMILKSSEDTFVYNEKGEVVFSLNGIGCQDITTFSNGLSIADNNKCINIDGKTVFEFSDIDYSSVLTY
ncbi:MAG: hypothetical protein ACI4CT_09280 [Lachnospiraceae bacterium]